MNATRSSPLSRSQASADALEVSLDFLVGKTSVEIDAKTLKRLQDMQKLNDLDKAHLFEIIDAFLRKTKKNTQFK